MCNYSVGDKIVENGRVYEIFRIDSQDNGQKSTIIYFRPLFDEGTGLIGSIPVDNMADNEFRQPASVSEVNEVLSLLSKPSSSDLRIDTDELDIMLKTNRIKKMARAVNLLWRDKNNDESTFSPTKRRLFKKALRAVSEEYANAKDTTLEKAEIKIYSYLNKAS